MHQPLRPFHLLILIFCFNFKVNQAALTICDKKSVASDASKIAAASSSNVAVLSSSSKLWRPVQSSGGEDNESRLTSPLLPLDLLALNDPSYLTYLSSKPPPKTSTPRSSIARKLARPNFVKEFTPEQLENCLKLKGCSSWEAIRILESPDFDGLRLNYLNELPLVYLKRQILSPFEAFLKRFKYQNEFDLLLEHHAVYSATSTPFSNLVMKFMDHSDDPCIELLFESLVKNQSTAFEPLEIFFFEVWLSGGTAAWRFLQFYFKYSASETKNRSLIQVLADKSYSGPLSRDLMKFLLSIETFDINAKIHYLDRGDTDSSSSSGTTPFFHILVLDARLSISLLPEILTDPRLDVSVPTGSVTFAYESCLLTHTDLPITYVAALSGNVWAIFHLMNHDEIFKVTWTHKLFLFMIWHFLQILYLSLYNKYFKRT